MVERLLSLIFIFLIFFLDSLLGFVFLINNTLCISRGITILLKSTDFPNNYVTKIALRIPSWSYDLCMLSPMCLKQHKTVNHSKINEMVLNAERIWSVKSIHFHVVVLKNLRLSLPILHPFLLSGSLGPVHLHCPQLL